MRALLVRSPLPGADVIAAAARAGLAERGFEVRELELLDRPKQTTATPRALRVAQRIGWRADDRRRAAAVREAVGALHEGEPLLLLGAAALRLAPGLADGIRRHRPRLVVVEVGEGADWEEGAAFLRARAARVLLLGAGDAGPEAPSPAAVGGAAAAAALPEVPVYGLCYRFRDVYARSIDSLLATETIPMRIHVAQNAHPDDGALTGRCRADAAAGRIAGHVRYADNLYGTALADAYLRVFPPGPDADVVVLTDLDIEIPPAHRGWLREALERLRTYPEVHIVTVDFDLSNWDPETARGHVPAPPSSWDPKRRLFRVPSGLWLAVMRRWFVDEYLAGPRPLADKFLYAHLERTVRGAVFGRLPAPCLHLSWDAQRGDDSYRVDKYENFYREVYRRHPVGASEVRRPDGAAPDGARR